MILITTPAVFTLKLYNCTAQPTLGWAWSTVQAAQAELMEAMAASIHCDCMEHDTIRNTFVDSEL